MDTTRVDAIAAAKHLRCSAQVKFEALEDVSELAITQMISPEKEIVPMMTPVDPVEKSVEVWMVEVEDMMRLSVRHVMHLAIQVSDSAQKMNLNLTFS